MRAASGLRASMGDRINQRVIFILPLSFSFLCENLLNYRQAKVPLLEWPGAHSAAAAAWSDISASIIALTPLYMSWTRSFSERPSLRLLEISKMPSEVSECSPREPRIWTLY